MLQSPPSLFEHGGFAFAECTEVSDEVVRGLCVRMQGLLGPALRAAGWCRSGQGVDAGGGDVGGGTGLDPGDPQRGAVWDGEKLPVAAERLAFLAEQQVVAVIADASEAVGFDQRAVEDHVGDAYTSAAVQDLSCRTWSLVGEDIDAFVEVTVTGGLGIAGVPGQEVHAAALAKPTQY